MRLILEQNRQKENIFRPNAMLNRDHQVRHDGEPVH